MKEELEQALLDKIRPAKNDYELRARIKESVTPIINLVDKKVIGEDEEIPMENRMSDIEQVRLFNQVSKVVYGRNALRAKQRAKLKGVSNAHKKGN